MPTPATASQTVGPYFSIGLAYRNHHALCTSTARGEHLEIVGQVLDGEDIPVPDAMLELWQADSNGHFAGLNAAEDAPAEAGFVGFARIPTDAQGAFHVHTVRPGVVQDLNGKPQAPHLCVVLFMRGILKHLYTRIYFEGDPRNADDPVLLSVPAERRATLCAITAPEQAGTFQWNIHLQGDHETVFFDY